MPTEQPAPEARSLAIRLQKLADRLMVTTEFHPAAHTVLEAAAELSADRVAAAWPNATNAWKRRVIREALQPAEPPAAPEARIEAMPLNGTAQQVRAGEAALGQQTPAREGVTPSPAVAAPTSDTPITEAFLTALYIDHRRRDLNDAAHYIEKAGELAKHARRLESTANLMRDALRSLQHHWTEFGPDGMDEAIEQLPQAALAAWDALKP